MLTYLAHIMHRCYESKSLMSKARSKFLLKCYVAYILGTIIFHVFIIIIYDIKTGNAKHTLEPLNGYCNFLSKQNYSTLNILLTNTVFNKVTQIVMLAAYLYYLYNITTKNEFTNGSIINIYL